MSASKKSLIVLGLDSLNLSMRRPGVGGVDLGAERAGFDIRAAGAPGEL
jgi:hypothetical protein